MEYCLRVRPFTQIRKSDVMYHVFFLLPVLVCPLATLCFFRAMYLFFVPYRMASTHDSNDEDGETSSASEDSSTSAGYPSPQARGRRPSKRAEPCAGIRQLPPAQRARLQLKETESLVHARWSPASSGYAVATPPATVAQERDSPRQLPRLAALEETCQQHQQQQIPQNAHQQKQVQQQQQRPVGSGALSVASLMQLPSLVATGRTSSSSLSSNASNSSSKTLREAAAAAAAGVTAAAAVAAAVATSPVTAPHSSPTLPSAQGLQHVGSRNHVVLSAGMNLQQPTPLEGWSLNERRQVPRMETLGRAPSPATAAAAVAEARMQQRRWDPAYSSTAVPTGGFAQGAYGGVDRCDSRHQHESGWARHAYSTVAPGFGWEAGCRRQYEQQTQAQQQQTALAAGATTTRGAWTQQTLPHAFHSQQEQEQQCFRQQHRIQNQPHDTRYGAQPMQPNKVCCVFFFYKTKCCMIQPRNLLMVGGEKPTCRAYAWHYAVGRVCRKHCGASYQRIDTAADQALSKKTIA